MPKKPFDPALGVIHKSRRKGNKLRGQQGYGVKYAHGRFRGDHVQDMQGQGRSGSYEARNMGGYGPEQSGALEQNQGDQGVNNLSVLDNAGALSKEYYE